jgi:hypothetical protein
MIICLINLTLYGFLIGLIVGQQPNVYLYSAKNMDSLFWVAMICATLLYFVNLVAALRQWK